jgi:penicillin amidase
MLALQTDVYSDADHVIAQRLAYAIDHASKPELAHNKRLHQAADLLRDWNGTLDADAPAPSDLSQWRYGQFHPLEIDHAIYSRSPLLERLIGVCIGTGLQPQSGDDVTVKQVGRNFGPSERFTADLANLDQSTLNLVLGESANPLSHWFMDQWPAWYHGTTFPLPFSNPAVDAATTHTLTLTPK